MNEERNTRHTSPRYIESKGQIPRRRLACIRHGFRHSARPNFADEFSSTRGQTRVDHRHYLLRNTFARWQPARTPLRQQDLADGMRFCGGDSGWRLRNEWPTPGRLRNHAPLVGTAFSRHAARILSPGKLAWDAGILVERTLGSISDALLLLTLTSGGDSSDLGRTIRESPAACRPVPEIYLLRAHRDRSCFGNPSRALI
jgi:hypothetical protein